ncbi:MAG: acyl-CoA synthetase [Halioglobus sp.]
MNNQAHTASPTRSLVDIEAIEEIPFEKLDLPASTFELIRQAAAARPQHAAIRYIENGESWAGGSVDISYAEFLSYIHRTANLFRSLGVSATDAVSMVLPNVPEAHYVLWGGEACGIVNPINYLLDAREIGEIVQSAGSKLLVVYGEHPELDIWAKLPTVLEVATCVQHVLVVAGNNDAVDGHLNFNKSIAAECADKLTFDRTPASGDVASLFHTGGTTGLPKLAQHTHGNEVYLAWALNRVNGGAGDACHLVGLPLFHCNAAIGTGLSPFMTGDTVILAGINGFRTPGIVPRLYELIEHFQVTNFSAVPTVYGVLSQLPVDGRDLGSMRFAVCGAAPMPVELFNKFQKHTGIRLLEGYGLTEATVCSSITPLGSESQRIGSIGVRIPYTRMKSAVLDEAGSYVRDCGVDEVGSLLIAGPSVTPGYTEESKNEGLFVSDGVGDTWLNTGDLARCDADGYFWLTGREKELIIRGGHNIDPKTIEEVLAQHPAVNLAAAIGRPDKYAGEIPVAYVDTHQVTSSDELIAFCEQHIGERAAVPKDIIILDSLPVTGVGKIHKPTLSLMELKSLVVRELQFLDDEVETLEVEAVADKKFGNMARVKAVAKGGRSLADMEAGIREILGAYSFRTELTVESVQRHHMDSMK